MDGQNQKSNAKIIVSGFVTLHHFVFTFEHLL